MVFRMTSLEILKGLSIGGNSGNSHFVRCVRPTLDYKPRAFHVRPSKWLCENCAANIQAVLSLIFEYIFTEWYGLSANSRLGHPRYSCVTAKRIPSTHLLYRVPQKVNWLEKFGTNLVLKTKNENYESILDINSWRSNSMKMLTWQKTIAACCWSAWKWKDGPLDDQKSFWNITMSNICHGNFRPFHFSIKSQKGGIFRKQ